jgi:Trk K+ transport system NAD-binding subunit
MEGNPGVLIIGSNRFTVELAKSLVKAKRPTVIVDSSWENLSLARQAGLTTFHGDMLSEQTEYNFDTIPYDYMLAITDGRSFNSLICTTFLPEYGRTNVFKVSPYQQVDNGYSKDIVSQVGGRILFDKKFSLEDLNGKVEEGFVVRQTTLTEQYNFDSYKKDKDPSTVFLYLIKTSGQLKFFSEEMRTVPVAGDTIVCLTPPIKEKNKIEAKLNSNRNSDQ